jgi:hypothetical protein
MFCTEKCVSAVIAGAMINPPIQVIIFLAI